MEGTLGSKDLNEPLKNSMGGGDNLYDTREQLIFSSCVRTEVFMRKKKQFLGDLPLRIKAFSLQDRELYHFQMIYTCIQHRYMLINRSQWHLMNSLNTHIYTYILVYIHTHTHMTIIRCYFYTKSLIRCFPIFPFPAKIP